MSRHYLDAASGQRLHPAAQLALDGFADRSWADPLLAHHEGRLARQLLEAARQTVALALGIAPIAVSFQRSGERAALVALSGFSQGPRQVAFDSEHNQTSVAADCTVVASAVERADVLRAANQVTTDGDAQIIPVDSCGAIDLSDFESKLATTESHRVACVQAGNIELGTLQPLDLVASACIRFGVPLVIDGTGYLGYRQLPTNWSALFADALSWAGPRGIAVVAISPNAGWQTPDLTATRPADLDDVAGAIAAAAALDAVHHESHTESARLSALIDRLRGGIRHAIPDIELLGDSDNRLPHTMTFSCLYADGEVLATELDRRGFAVGSGSACATRTGLPSHVLTAIGALTHGNIRISLPLGCSDEAVEELLAALPAAVAYARAEAGAPS